MNDTRPASNALHHQIVHIVYTFIGMSGWRLRHLNLLWVVGGVASLGFYAYLFGFDMLGVSVEGAVVGNTTAHIGFYLFTVVFYYFGLIAFFGAGMHRRMCESMGEEKAFRTFQTLLALMFINQGLGVGAMSSLQVPGWEFPLSHWQALAVGGVLTAIGIIIKVWATVLTTIDIYYLKDLFVGHPVTGFVEKGPYKFLSNPMYGVGQFHAYGIAVLFESTTGVLAAAICHVLIYTFYYVIERPFVVRTYLSGANKTG